MASVYKLDPLTASRDTKSMEPNPRYTPLNVAVGEISLGSVCTLATPYWACPREATSFSLNGSHKLDPLNTRDTKYESDPSFKPLTFPLLRFLQLLHVDS